MPSIDKKKIGLLIWFKFINKKILKLIYLKKIKIKIKKKKQKKAKKKKRKKEKKMGWLPEGVAATPLGGGGGSQAIPKKNWGGCAAPQR
jgi:hypothetical protein